VSLSTVRAQLPDGWELIFSDEFDGSDIDMSKWEHEVTAGGGGNGEFQVYTPDPANSYLQDGKLFVRTTLLSENINPQTGEPFGEDFLTSGVLDLEALYGVCNVPDWNGCYRTGGDIPPIASGKVRSNQKFSYRYGYSEISAKMTVGDWLWPAMWMLPDKWYYGGWPMSGEIDIIESIGNRNYRCNGMLQGIQHMGSTLHWGVEPSQNKWHLTHASQHNEENNYGDNFHMYGLLWTPEGMEWFLDGESMLKVPNPWITERTPDNCFTGFYDLGAPWSGNPNDPWTPEVTCDHFMAPFDQDFHFLFNVAVGGQWYIPEDGCVNWDGEAGRQKPWQNGGGQQGMMWDFYNAKDGWLDTWTNEGDNVALQVDYVRVYQPPEGFARTQVPEGCPVPPGPDNCPAP